MYAIVEIQGQQFKVEKGLEIFVHRLEGNEGDKVEFDQVLLTEKDGKVEVGMPVIEKSKVTGKIVEHVQGDKVMIFKKKRRKGYKVKRGHRQQFTKVSIEGVK